MMELRRTWRLVSRGGAVRQPGREGGSGGGGIRDVTDVERMMQWHGKESTWSFMRATRGEIMRVILLRPLAMRQATSEGSWYLKAAAGGVRTFKMRGKNDKKRTLGFCRRLRPSPKIRRFRREPANIMARDSL
jgi:hypothetical protein